MEVLDQTEPSSETAKSRRDKISGRLNKKKLLGFGALVAAGAAMLATDNNPEIMQYSTSVGSTTVEFNPLIMAAATGVSAMGINITRRERKKYNELLDEQLDDGQSPYANPNIAIQEETIKVIKSERFRRVGALVIATIAAGSFLIGKSDPSVIHESSDIDNLGIVVITDSNSRTQDVTTDSGEKITRLKASVDGALQTGDALKGTNTTYVAASGGQSGVKIIGESDGSRNQDEVILAGYEAFAADLVSSLPAATVENVDTALRESAHRKPEHRIVIGDFKGDIRTPEFVGEEADGVSNISLISFGSADTTSQAISLVGEEDAHTARSTEDAESVISQIIDNNSLTTTQETDMSKWFNKTALLSSTVLVGGVLSSGIKRPNFTRRKRIKGE